MQQRLHLALCLFFVAVCAVGAWVVSRPHHPASPQPVSAGGDFVSITRIAADGQVEFSYRIDRRTLSRTSHYTVVPIIGAPNYLYASAPVNPTEPQKLLLARTYPGIDTLSKIWGILEWHWDGKSQSHTLSDADWSDLKDTDAYAVYQSLEREWQARQSATHPAPEPAHTCQKAKRHRRETVP